VTERTPEGGIELSSAEIDALDARWSSSWTPSEVARRLAGVAAPWCVAAGWALELFRGTRTREHGDIEIAIPAATYQTWLRDPRSGDYLLDVFREPHDGEAWICRHDDTIRLPYSEIIQRTSDGIPYLAPELVLLFKAKHVRPKDQSDFDETIPYLSRTQLTALAGFLARPYPRHHWLDRLDRLDPR